MITIKEIKPFKIFKTILSILFIIFIINYYQINNGYVENKINQKAIITQNNIKEFENDIKNNEYIDTKKYNQDEYIDTNTPITKLGLNVSEGINKIVTEYTKEIYEFIKKFF